MCYILSDRLSSSLYTGGTRDLLVLLRCLYATASWLFRPAWLTARISRNVGVMHETWIHMSMQLTLPTFWILHLHLKYLLWGDILVWHVLHHFLETLGLLDDGIIWIPVIFDKLRLFVHLIIGRWHSGVNIWRWHHMLFNCHWVIIFFQFSRSGQMMSISC